MAGAFIPQQMFFPKAAEYEVWAHWARLVKI
jgi:hypothetical protein